jgi:two-component system, NtrC family, response regulator HydG
MKELDYKQFPILVVDDEADNREIFRLNFRREFNIVLASNGAEAIEILKKQEISVIITDHRMPNMTGLQLLQEIMITHPNTIRIMLTAYTETELLLKGINEGQIYRYIVKPWDAGDMRVTIRRAIERFHLEAENRRLLEELSQVNTYLRHEIEHDWSEVIGSDQGLAQVMSEVSKVAPTPTTVLLRGESGTGKELIARAVHLTSPRAKKSLIKVNCAAIPETLLESELFGHEKGAFTGAHVQRKGRFELADGGTIFLDEIGDMSPATQVKLLRVLQEQQFERLGGTKTLQINTRVIAATNRPLEKMIQDGSFRQDLFFRLSIFPIELPPLRRRLDDIPALARFFLKRYAVTSGKNLKDIDADALERLRFYPWPGNVRELENVIERATILAGENTLTLDDLRFLDAYAFAMRREESQATGNPVLSAAPAADVPLPESLKRLEKEVLVKAMEDSKGSKAKAARELGINRSTLYYRLRKHGLAVRYGLSEE